MISNKILGLVVSALLASTNLATAATASSTSPMLSLAQDQGAADPSQNVTITVYLKLPNRASFEQALAALYQPGSPTFHQWMTDAELKQFAASPAQIQAVQAELERNGLTVLSISKNGFSLRAHGSIGNISRAFNTPIHQFSINGSSFRSNTINPTLSGGAAAFVDTVSGLESHTVRPSFTRAINRKTGKPYPAIALRNVAEAGGLSGIITDQALGASQTLTYTTPNAALPTATYTGILYQPDQNLTPDFTPKQLQAVYGLNAAYSKGLDGTGQTIVLLEAYGYPTAKQDANASFAMTGLPQLTSANFKIVYPDGQPANPNIGVLAGWNGEIALDIQWAHAMAPGAKIVVVASNGQDNEDFQASMQYIIDKHLGNTVSDSWESDTDLIAGPAEQESFEYILEEAAAKGISFQFSTGDGGDGGLGSPVGAAGVPSVAPHATAVGGTAILNQIGSKNFVNTGWGDSLVFIDGDGPVDPPTSVTLFLGGGGGGSSVFWPKPAWQKSLPGSYRQTPDVSALADPYTGVPVVITDPTTNTETLTIGNGGTSLACPIFSAIWAIANQKAGHALGLAAPIIAALKSGITDVKPQSSPDDITGSVTDSNGTTNYTTQMLFQSLLADNAPFFAANWNQPQYNQALAFGFSLDSSLTLAKGWDNQTGYGTPSGLAFIDAAAAYK